MKVFCEKKNSRMRVLLSGELDHNVARGVMSNIDALIDENLPRECVLDMGSISFMDSSGIAVILRTNKHMAEVGGRTWVENCEGQALRVLDAAGVDRVVKVYSK